MVSHHSTHQNDDILEDPILGHTQLLKKLWSIWVAYFTAVENRQADVIRTSQDPLAAPHQIR